MYLRRLLTISVLIVATIVAVILAPAVLVSAFLMSFLPKFKTTPQAVAFIYGFICYEWIGLGKFAWVWVRYQNIDKRVQKDRDVQFWWARSLFEMGKWLFNLKIEVTGEDAIAGNCALVLCRHTSMADTVLPLLFFGQARAEGLRYVLKQELRLLPCALAELRRLNRAEGTTASDEAGVTAVWPGERCGGCEYPRPE